MPEIGLDLPVLLGDLIGKHTEQLLQGDVHISAFGNQRS